MFFNVWSMQLRFRTHLMIHIPAMNLNKSGSEIFHLS